VRVKSRALTREGEKQVLVKARPKNREKPSPQGGVERVIRRNHVFSEADNPKRGGKKGIGNLERFA